MDCKYKEYITEFETISEPDLLGNQVFLARVEHLLGIYCSKLSEYISTTQCETCTFEELVHIEGKVDSDLPF